MFNIALDTLGCKLNQAETEAMGREFAQAGYHLVSPQDNWDIYILNTCTVTHVADRKARYQMRIARRHNPSGFICLTGCYAENGGNEISCPDANLILDNRQKTDIVNNIIRLFPLENSASALYEKGRTRSFIKIQDGCDNFCAYCIVPFVRRYKNCRGVDDIISEINLRQAEGYQEIVLTGTEIGEYTSSGLNLAGLIEAILERTRIPRLRLSSLQPNEITLPLLALWKNRRLCNHFHMALQSGSDRILGLMNRPYSMADYTRTLEAIRRQIPDVAVTTDMIVGFPGETDEDFACSLKYVEQAGFARVHPFPYSERPGTMASQLTDKVDPVVIKTRLSGMMLAAKNASLEYCRQSRDLEKEVLWENKMKDGLWFGYTPDYIRVYGKFTEKPTNTISRVKLAKVYADGVLSSEIASQV
ncbi:MAG: tRNA (N(6)-L-threonylcarbamoyladenosine(37)-C(2))-methylthiotransferase MtaB [Dehalococcoides mccartyi]|uniref:tRNA (N(6)-L-threonylcarbamoyladenosine(37)-C(2))- methylthiotransferase MtaB n=1 Tax=Dehalococcoides mccartyi TaxID=61435 RepID=UPI000805A5A4|nr:tRNA (N(6)-L-threonylcarbamoyladenosine(37)-C(2))-methylthiotransferase MtaB [Dehalococcoides mccartyi]OBW63439.1 MAG: tRNA (N(6)-L-threonylcarbamoyladenosine(37)-C(2))-methylthiotransferase MtaB [Dehalococcoides mccartyi]